nr:MAG TPA: hypothetical protein [Caudoviricetes sp.]
MCVGVTIEAQCNPIYLGNVTLLLPIVTFRFKSGHLYQFTSIALYIGVPVQFHLTHSLHKSF